MTRNERITEKLELFAAEKKEKILHDDFADGGGASIKLEVTQYEGSDSGVEMNSRCCHCRSNLAEADSETDSCLIGSSNGHSPMYYSADIGDLVSSARKLSLIDNELNDEQLLTSYDAASENGSESSSVDDTKKCGKTNCSNLSSPKQNGYGAKGSRRQALPSSRAKGVFASDSLKFGVKASPKSTLSINESDSRSAKPSPTDCKNRIIRSCSVTRARTPASPDENKWSDCRVSRTRLTPASNIMDKITTFEAYATLPRRKQRDASCNVDSNRNTPREPSLNRAASLRKKYLENSLMTTSLNGSLSSPSSSSSSSVKTIPPYSKSRSSKTKIYHEVASQTCLTNNDVDHALADRPFHLYNNVEIQADAEYRIKKRFEDQMASSMDELKKLKKENSKQRTVIEWLEGELASTKDEKFVLQNKLNSIEQRIHSLLRHKGSGEDIFHQLEREVSYSGTVIAQQQEEIAELQQICTMQKKDLEKNYAVQKTLIETQKVNEAESLELQEFLQAEKSTLTDSLRDTELELNVCRNRLAEAEQELTQKNNEYSNLETTCEQLREENAAIKLRLTSLERRCRELLLHQGAAISSASVALSGLGSRFEQLLEQLVTAYRISDVDLQDKACQNDVLSDDKRCDNNDAVIDSSRLKSWLKAIRDITSKTSAEKQDCNLDAESAKEATTCEKPLEMNCIVRRGKVTGERRPDSVLNLISGDDALYPSKLEEDGRRQSILTDVYTGVDNLTLEFGVNESLNDLASAFSVTSGVAGIKDCSTQDVSLVEQIKDIDNLITKVFKAILLAQSRHDVIDDVNDTSSDDISAEREISDQIFTDTKDLSKGNDVSVRNGCAVPEINSKEKLSESFAHLQMQHKAITNTLSMLHKMPEIVSESIFLKRIQTDLEYVNGKCDSFLSSIHSDATE